MAVKYSRQRQVIHNFLMTRKDHPTADVVYQNVRQEDPHISLGTVYRNLTLLADRGEILRLHVGDGVDHFDAETSLHSHFVCTRCGCVTDLSLNCLEDMINRARQVCNGEIENLDACFHGVCADCLNAAAGQAAHG